MSRRVSATAIVLAPAFVVVAASSARAQIATSTELRSQMLSPFATSLAERRAVESATAAARLDRPWLALAWDGVLSRDTRQRWTPRTLASGALYSSALGPLSFTLSASALAGSRPAAASPVAASRAMEWTTDASVAYRVRRSGAWLSVGAARQPGPVWRSAPAPPTDSVSLAPTSSIIIARPAPHFAYGVWHQMGRAVVSVSVDARSLWQMGTTTRIRHWTEPISVFDSVAQVWREGTRQRTSLDSSTVPRQARSSDAEARVVWAGGRWTIDAAAGQRVAGLSSGARWLRGETSYALDPRLAFIVAAGSADRTAALTMGALSAHADALGHPYLSFGVRISPTALLARPRPAAPIRSVATSFTMRREGDDTYRLIVEVPLARTVEVAGDFTQWKAVSLTRRAGGRWDATFRLTPGAHQVNLRVDGERWVAPPGTTIVADDFAGTVGVVVVQ